MIFVYFACIRESDVNSASDTWWLEGKMRCLKIFRIKFVHFNLIWLKVNTKNVNKQNNFR